jgi:hypothetical protein
MGLEKVEPLSTILIKAGAKRVLKDLVSNSTNMCLQVVNSNTWSQWLCVWCLSCFAAVIFSLSQSWHQFNLLFRWMSLKYSLLAFNNFHLTIHSVSPHMNAECRLYLHRYTQLHVCHQFSYFLQACSTHGPYLLLSIQCHSQTFLQHLWPKLISLVPEQSKDKRWRCFLKKQHMWTLSPSPAEEENIFTLSWVSDTKRNRMNLKDQLMNCV